ncbi:MAG: adenosylhomocysteinase [Thermoprotei archaeon]|nr:MAG: adenosylhomocysteinase [Thermoprotei archaeon]
MEYRIRNIGLADKGRNRIYWAERSMPVLMKIREKFSKSRPLEGVRIGASLHVTKETAVLMRTLVAGGAEITLVPCNPLSTQDDVAAALVEEGISVYAWRGMKEEEYYWAIGKALDSNPNITMDDGADIVSTVHKLYYNETGKDVEVVRSILKKPIEEILSGIIGGTEETTTGVLRLRALEKAGLLKYPIIAVNEAFTKYLFDNRYGTGQSTLDGIIRATNMLLAGKRVVIAGYGWCGRGIAMRAKGMGAHVIITEVNPIRALEAVYDGFEVMPMDRAAEIGDVFITATGDINVIRKEHMLKMKSGAVLANAGHFNVEINLRDLEEIAEKKRQVRENVTEYILADGRRIYLLAEGRLVNLVAAEGHPSEVMDMSFSNQAMAVKFLVEHRSELKPKVYKLPQEMDENIARMKLEALGISIDELTEEQQRYLSEWKLGT